ncbi:MAG TPA: peptidoglycan DD-metalloendopeptidase family protein [Bacteroidales bacterium]|nr:peptidoglycan DD-metalloendopeptidase family protein [Bacteroidales bacterium]HPS73091.1 peptidoglycan DD-metalloendopeptidase family protein [Bacteroidales bacterium]
MTSAALSRLSCITIIFCILLPGFFLADGTVQGQSRQNLNKTKKQLETEIEYTNSLLDQTKKSKETSLNKLRLLNRQIDRREALIQTISAEIGSVDNEIATSNQTILSLKEELNTLKQEYARMILYAYRTMRTNNRLVFIFSSKDFNQAYHRLRYYRQYAEFRRKQADKIRQTQAELLLKQQDLHSIRDQKVELADAQEKSRQKLTREKQEKDNTVKELTKREKELLATLKTKQNALNKLQAEIEKLIANERAFARRAGSKTSTEMSSTLAEKKLSGTFAASRGSLPWPSEKGVVVSTFGEHPHPVLKYVKVKNNGIDISVTNGTTIRSVFQGKVSRILSVPNLNKVVIIRHGEYLTVYSNMQEVNVSEGQEVKTKQTIGKIHSDPEDGKSELHFEIWLGKTIQDPQEWLSR